MFSTACSSDRPGPFSSEHWTSNAWIGALEQQPRHPAEWAPTATLLALLPWGYEFDNDLQDDSRDNHYLTGGVTVGGDVVSQALAGAALAIGGVGWWHGDEGRFFEVAVESVLATTAATHALKFVAQRPRPDDPGTTDSFPSGHTSLATSGATLIARWADERFDTKWGYLAFVPATYVALTRMEGDRHYSSDVLAGAALGVFVTNWVFDAHYGDAESKHALYGPRAPSEIRVLPYLDASALGLSLSWSF